MSVLISNKLQLVIQRIFFAILGIMECVIKLQIEALAMIGRYLLFREREREKLVYYRKESLPSKHIIGSKKLVVCRNQFDLAVKKNSVGNQLVLQ